MGRRESLNPARQESSAMSDSVDFGHPPRLSGLGLDIHYLVLDHFIAYIIL